MRHEDNVGYKMRLIHNRIHKQMEAKRIENEGNITGMQRWTLGYLNDHADTEIYQKDIEQEFKVSRATASNMLQLMERKGLIVPNAPIARERAMVILGRAMGIEPIENPDLTKYADAAQVVSNNLLSQLVSVE